MIPRMLLPHPAHITVSWKGGTDHAKGSGKQAGSCVIILEVLLRNVDGSLEKR